jgi:hypothetical protein
MAARRTTFDKLQRERAKKAKAAAKRERRHDRSETPAEMPVSGGGNGVTAAVLLERIANLHTAYDAKEMEFEEFEEEKLELLAQLAALPSDDGH